jgi:acetyl-CoA synthetase
MITPIPGATPTKPGTATLPFFGIDPASSMTTARSPANTGGKLVIRKPWPSMLRGVWGDRTLQVQPTGAEVQRLVLHRRRRRSDKDGYFWIVGRIDDVLNVAGHRIGTAEVESALVSHPAVAEAAVVGRPDELKGQALVVLRHPQDRHQPPAPN